MSTSQDDHIDQLVQARWRAIGLSQNDLAEILCTGAGPRGSNGGNAAIDAAKIDAGRLATVAEVLGIAADIVNSPTAATAKTTAKAGVGGHAAQSLQSLLELRMLRVFREVQNPDIKRILIELVDQIVKHQAPPPEAG